VLAVILAAVVLGGVLVYYTERFAIASVSMEPTLAVGDTVWALRRFRTPERGDLVAFESDGGVPLVKRIIGMPGERIEAIDGVVHIDRGQLDESVWTGVTIATDDFGPVELGPADYFVMGDNRSHSIDSRHYGPITEDQLAYIVLLDRDDVG
jgi:signal peptidase I